MRAAAVIFVIALGLSAQVRGEGEKAAGAGSVSDSFRGKLVLKERVEIPYILEFTSVSGELFGIREKKADGKESRLFVRKDQHFFDRFTVLEFEERKIFDAARGFIRQLGILTVRDNASGKRIELIQRKPVPLPTSTGVFHFKGKDGSDVELKIKEGDVFRLPDDPGQFKLLAFSGEALVEIVPCDPEGVPTPGASRVRIGSGTSSSAPSGSPSQKPEPPSDRRLSLPPKALTPPASENQ